MTQQEFQLEMVQRTTRIESAVTSHSSRLEKIEAAIVGNGKPGLGTRVDRIEQARKRNKWLLGILLTALVGGGATWAFTLIH